MKIVCVELLERYTHHRSGSSFYQVVASGSENIVESANGIRIPVPGMPGASVLFPWHTIRAVAYQDDASSGPVPEPLRSGKAKR